VVALGTFTTSRSYTAILIEAAVIGIDALQAEALRRIETVVVGLFQVGLFSRHGGVVLVRRPGNGVTFTVYTSTTSRLSIGFVIRENVVHQALVTAFTTVLHADIVRRNQAYG
jgi:hypothetical protein